MPPESQDYIFTDVAFMAQRRARAHAIARLGLLIFFVQGAAWTAMEFFDGLAVLAQIDLVATSFSAVLLLLLRRGHTTLVKHAAFWLFFANAWLIVFVGDGIGPGAQLITLWWFAVLALGSYLLFFDSHRAVLLGYQAACVASFALVVLLPVQVPALAPPPPDFFDVVRPVSYLLQLLTMLAIVHTFTRDIAQAEVQLSTANNRLEGLLENILPAAISKRLREDGRSFAEGYADVSVMFADIVGFTELASSRPPREIVDLLDRVFSRFDDITETLGLEKIKTIGDAYMVASGVPGVREDHAEVLAQLALRLREAITEFPPLTLRIGINSGAVVAGVIGKKRFIYDVWGDAVNVASRMESHGIAGQIQVTEATYELLRDRFEFEERGFIEVKGKGPMKVYLLGGAGRDSIVVVSVRGGWRMRRLLRFGRSATTGLLGLLMCLRAAQGVGAGIEGLWMTVSDKTGKPESIVRLVEREGELRGTIEEIFPKPGDPANPRCEKCKGEFRDRPIAGLQFLWGFRREGDRYGPGRILDPDEGEVYRCELELAEDGRTLKVRGYIGIPLFGRTRVWVRRP